VTHEYALHAAHDRLEYAGTIWSEYLHLTEEEVEASGAKNPAFADRLVYVLLVLGVIGATAGLVAG
jgi:hypothetical protein